MALSILTNPVAIGTQGSVNNANNALAKTIKQLSSGLRINSAADDASGLAVSEKLRGQISGLKVAARNAQDGISFLQTAEAAMGTMTSMVQRVRELAVQAGDPAYTDGDRVMLQTEVDQLKEEINRVSSSAEFNTKKLLNGDSAALWSATGGIDAIVRGATVEGNYKIASTLTPGTNNVYKTQAMNVGNGKQSFTMTTAGGGITRLDNIQGTLAGRAVAIAVTTGTAAFSATAGSTTSTRIGFSAAITMTGSASLFIDGQAGSIEVKMLKNVTGAGTVSAAVSFRVTNLVTGKQSEWVTLDALHVTGTLTLKFGGTAAVALSATSALFTSVGLKAATTLSAAATVRGNNTTTGAAYLANRSVTGNILTDTVSVNTAVTSTLISQTGGGLVANPAAFGENSFGSFTVEMEAISSNRIKYRAMNAETGALSAWYEVDTTTTGAVKVPTGAEALNSIGIRGGTIFRTAAGTFDNTLNVGDKALVEVSGRRALTAGTSLTGSGMVEVAGGPAVFVRNLVSASKENTVRLFSAQMDSAGKAYYGSMDALMAQTAIAQAGTATVSFIKAGDAASTSTRLSDLSNFVNADGVNVLDNTQTLTIYGNGRQTNISLDKADTIKTFEDKMRAAIVDGLGMGSDSASDVNANLVKFMSSDVVTPNGDRAVPGTFIFQGAKLGASSEISFSGNQNVINALGVANIQEANISQLQVTVSNAHNGTFVGSTTTSDGVARGLIRNVDLKLDMAAGTDITWDATGNKLVFTPNAGTESFLHLKNNATVAAIGANEGQTLDISIGRMDTTSLGIDDVSVLTLGAAQKSISKLDLALDEINKSRAVVGAQMNRLDYTINNLNVTRENMMSAESRIRDLDMAEAATNLTAQQVRLQAATAMLAQANQLPTYAAQLLR